jgi:hypothetical protein
LVKAAEEALEAKQAEADRLAEEKAAAAAAAAEAEAKKKAADALFALLES